jgi:hypothetical protein
MLCPYHLRLITSRIQEKYTEIQWRNTLENVCFNDRGDRNKMNVKWIGWELDKITLESRLVADVETRGLELSLPDIIVC